MEHLQGHESYLSLGLLLWDMDRSNSILGLVVSLNITLAHSESHGRVTCVLSRGIVDWMEGLSRAGTWDFLKQPHTGNPCPLPQCTAAWPTLGLVTAGEWKDPEIPEHLLTKLIRHSGWSARLFTKGGIPNPFLGNSD